MSSRLTFSLPGIQLCWTKRPRRISTISPTLRRHLMATSSKSRATPSNTLSKEADQKLSEDRAAVVAQYLREVKEIPLRRILVPVGYGATHPAVSNKDPYDRELNRHVDIKVLVNKSLGQGL